MEIHPNLKRSDGKQYESTVTATVFTILITIMVLHTFDLDVEARIASQRTTLTVAVKMHCSTVVRHIFDVVLRLP